MKKVNISHLTIGCKIKKKVYPSKKLLCFLFSESIRKERKIYYYYYLRMFLYFMFQNIICRNCDQVFASSLARRRHEENCRGIPQQCKYCNSILHTQRDLNNHEAQCKKRREDESHEKMLQREADINNRLADQQEQQIQDEHAPQSNHHVDDLASDLSSDGCSNDNKPAQIFECTQCRKHFRNVQLFQKHRQSHFGRKKKEVCV